MARSHNYDELDEMLVPQDHNIDDEGDAKASKPKKQVAKKTPRQLAREAAKQREKRQTIIVLVVCFLVLLTALIGVGMLMSKRAGVNSGDNDVVVKKAEPMPGRTYFKGTQLPELSSEGVKGTLKEVYYTVNGGLAVTLNLSNGMSTEQELVKLGVTLFNDESGNIAKYTIDKFKPVCRVKAGGRTEYYFEIAKQYVTVTDDPLKKLTATLEIGSKSTANELKDGQQSDGKGPKDIAPNRTYYENLGNLPALSAEGVKASVIRAQYTNDGSLALTMSFSNGTDAKKTVSMVDLLIANGEGTTIADYTFDSFDEPIEVEAQSYKEYLLFVESAYVPVKDDSLTSLAMTISVSAG